MASAPCIRIIRGGTHADRCCSILILRSLFDKQKAIGGAQAFGVRGREISVHCSTDSLRECGSGACISPGHTSRQACATDQRNVGNQQSLLGHSPWHNAADDRVWLRLRYCRQQARRPLQETAARQLPICFVNSDRKSRGGAMQKQTPALNKHHNYSCISRRHTVTRFFGQQP